MNEGLEVAEPEQVLAAVLVDHVLVQEVGVEWRDPSQLQVLVESLLQILVQVATLHYIHINSITLHLFFSSFIQFTLTHCLEMRTKYKEKNKKDWGISSYLKSGPS